MTINNEIYFENLNQEELAFLKTKVKKETSLYARIFGIMLVGAILISFAGAWENIQKEGIKAIPITIFSWQNYFITLALLASIFYLSIRVLKSTELSKVKRDLRQKTKIVEKVIIKKKTYLPHNNTFHFYLNSLQKLSIEVQENDFHQLSEGDEISIEYSKNAGIYFGYF